MEQLLFLRTLYWSFRRNRNGLRNFQIFLVISTKHILMNTRRKKILMDSPAFKDFKKQASFFFKEKIKTARLVLTDVTPAQLLNDRRSYRWESMAPNTPTMATIARAAFDIDDYWRIVDILHKRLSKFDVKDWRVSYKALILLEHLLTHGPKSFSDEFLDTKEIIKDMSSFQHIDEKRFDWGLRVRNLSERVLELLENSMFLREERSRARKLTRGIEGFGSFSQLCYFEEEEGWKDPSLKIYGRSQSERKINQTCSGTFYANEIMSSQGAVKVVAGNEKENHKNIILEKSTQESGSEYSSGEIYGREDHPFCEHELQTTTESLLFSVE